MSNVAKKFPKKNRRKISFDQHGRTSFLKAINPLLALKYPNQVNSLSIIFSTISFRFSAVSVL